MSDTRQESDNSALVSAVLLSLTAIPVVARPQKVRAFVQKITADAPQASILNFISEDARLRRQPPPAREGRDGVLPVKASLARAAPGPVPADLPELQRVHRRSKVRGSRSAIRERPS